MNILTKDVQSILLFYEDLFPPHSCFDAVLVYTGIFLRQKSWQEIDGWFPSPYFLLLVKKFLFLFFFSKNPIMVMHSNPDSIKDSTHYYS